jgi:hypothetical protein
MWLETINESLVQACIHKTGNLLLAYLIVKHPVEITAIVNSMRRYSLETQILGTMAPQTKQATTLATWRGRVKFCGVTVGANKSPRDDTRMRINEKSFPIFFMIRVKLD